MAALPWGSTEAATVGSKRGAPDDGEEGGRDGKRRGAGGDEGPSRQAMCIEDVGLGVGSKLEVKWDVEDDVAQEKRSLWWGCKVAKRSGGAADGDTWVLEYVAMEGFDAENREVRFLGEHQLEDVAETQTMYWYAPDVMWKRRLEGDLDFEVPEDEEHDDVKTLGDVLDEVEEDEQAAAEEGVSLQELEREELDKLPMEQQQQVANKFRDLADHLKTQMRQLAERNEGGYTVTKEDIQRMFSGMDRK